MANLEKYRGVIPAFYACYDAETEMMSAERVTEALAAYHFLRKGGKRPLCQRFFRRVHLPERGGPQDYTWSM